MWYYELLRAKTIKIKKGQYGAALGVEYKLSRSDKKKVPKTILVNEKIRVIKDTHKVFKHFKSRPNWALNGKFNDLYRLVNKEPLPRNFKLEIEQSYFVGNQLVKGKNKIVYNPESVLLFIWEKNRWRFRARGESRK